MAKPAYNEHPWHLKIVVVVYTVSFRDLDRK
jgi:hypothetical protein